jgi:hypothetical protein
MSRLDPRIGRWLLWLAPFALLALAIGWQTDWGRALRRAPPAEIEVAPAPVATAVLPEFQIDGGVQALAATVERPLFNATRRPAPVAVAEAPKPTIQRGQFTLTGTLITGSSAVAFLKEASGTGKARSVRKGDSVNGMTVAEVAPDRVRLTMGDESEDIELKVAKGPKTTTQPVPEAPAPQQVAGQPARPGQSQPGAAVAPVAGRARAGARAQGGLAGQGDATENLRANRRAARAAEAQGGAPADQTQPTQTPQSSQQRRQR